MSGILLAIIMALLLHAVSLSAAPAPPVPPVPVAQDRLVWPALPDKAQVEYLRAFSRPEDLGIAKSFFARLKDFLLGEIQTPLVRPMAVVASRGMIFVADPGAGGVHRFDTKNGDYTLIKGPDASPLPSAVGLALGERGEVYVADSRLAQVFILRAGADALETLRLDAVLKQPTGLAFDALTGNLYVLDTAEHRIAVFRRDGSLAASIGKRGTDDGEFNYPTHLWRTPEGRLYVTDSLNYRVQVFDAAGQFLSRFGRQGEGTGEAARPKGIATDHFGHIYVVDALFHAFQIFDQGGRLLLPVGERGQAPGEFWLPSGIYIDQEDRDTIYVADAYNQRIQVMRYIGGED